MDLFSQSKLLRVLEEKQIQHLGGHETIKVDVRIISSSNVLPFEAMERRQIREDLFYRLAVVETLIPELTSRRSDILVLAKHFIEHYNHKFGKKIKDLSEDIRLFFLKYHWPGNVRQLRHCIESAMNFVDERDKYIRQHHLPQYLFGSSFQGFLSEDPLNPYQNPPADNLPLLARSIAGHQNKVGELGLFEKIDEEEKKRVTEALYQSRGNIARAARSLNLPRHGLVYRLKKYGFK